MRKHGYFWIILIFLTVAMVARADELLPTDVFVSGKDGFASIRIPSVVVTRDGTLLAFAEGREARSDQARNKIVLKRSHDRGKNWSPIQQVATDGERALNNPCAVVERTSGRVLLLYQSYPAGLKERSNAIEPGYEGDRIVRNYLVTSDDDGQTWSSPRDLTRTTKRREKVTTVASGPGIGIQLRNGPRAGRILFPMNEGPFGLWNIYAIYSDDRGETWTMGETVPGGIIEADGKATSQVNEAQFAEINGGSIRFNVRRWAGEHVRKSAVSDDGGATWSAVEDASTLKDPGCMGSILAMPDPHKPEHGVLLFSGPQSTRRENGTLFLSHDQGQTWTQNRVLDRGSFGYSCLTSFPDGTVGCLYEADQANRIVFVRFSINVPKAEE